VDNSQSPSLAVLVKFTFGMSEYWHFRLVVQIDTDEY